MAANLFVKKRNNSSSCVPHTALCCIRLLNPNWSKAASRLWSEKTTQAVHFLKAEILSDTLFTNAESTIDYTDSVQQLGFERLIKYAINPFA